MNYWFRGYLRVIVFVKLNKVDILIFKSSGFSIFPGIVTPYLNFSLKTAYLNNIILYYNFLYHKNYKKFWKPAKIFAIFP